MRTLLAFALLATQALTLHTPDPTPFEGPELVLLQDEDGCFHVYVAPPAAHMREDVIRDAREVDVGECVEAALFVER